ncbi:MAG: asparagine synthase (glutamine-hydrolyzing), partial [Pirellulales bacterium]|nr:asparagine synthase (glutamine-hydrolyzing) [Pirellulales bacterium]
MCGIAGVLHFDGREACPERLRAMIAVMHHRGPDAAGILVDHGTGLAHARLSILDPANGRQPMQSTNGALTITFNGEIFNFIELRAELEARGHCLKTRSDTEVILHAYEEYGEKCVEHFNGQWALAIWDKQRKQLFLSRDRLGIRPLFYTQVNGQFLFASEIKSLFVLPEVRRELDSHGLSQLFTFWSTIAPTTVFRDIRELPPGRNLVIRRDQFQERTYWQLDYTPADGSIPCQAWAEKLRALLIDATQLRLRADVPVGAYLSGGLDSSITVALAQKKLNDRLRTFSVSFEDRQFDESDYQKLVVDFLNVEHHAMHCDHESIAEIFPEVVWHTEKPMLRTAPAPLFMLSELVHAAEFKVVLTGEGADEILGGYDIFKEAKVRRFYADCPNSTLRAALIQKLYPYLPSIQMQSAAMRQAFFRARPEDLTSPFFSHLPRWEMTGQLRRFFSQDFLSHHGQERLYEEIE